MIDHWFKLSPGEANALARIANLKKDPPAKLIMGRDEDDHLVVVPASKKDPRRWDITKGGKARKGTRDNPRWPA